MARIAPGDSPGPAAAGASGRVSSCVDIAVASVLPVADAVADKHICSHSKIKVILISERLQLYAVA
jgi:hypothetical protein